MPYQFLTRHRTPQIGGTSMFSVPSEVFAGDNPYSVGDDVEYSDATWKATEIYDGKDDVVIVVIERPEGLIPGAAV
jgi:hypothetical protein